MGTNHVNIGTGFAEAQLKSGIRAEVPKDLRIGQEYGTFAGRLQELSEKASRTETADNKFYGKITTYYDKDGNKIGSSAAPNQEKRTMGYIVNGKTTYFSDTKGKITHLGENGNVYSDKNGDGKIDESEKSSGALG